MEVNKCREPEKLQQHYLYFQMPVQNECASVSKENEESEKQVDTEDLNVRENAESKKGKKKERRHKKEKYREKHDENIVYVRKLKVPKRALTINNDNSVEAVKIEDNKCFKFSE
ncbi:hypothetical protein ACTXT7_005029 [Hymenolepis weldensis]